VKNQPCRRKNRRILGEISPSWAEKIDLYPGHGNRRLRLVGVTARNAPVVAIGTILVLSFLVCWLIDVARGRAGK
jgi:hypothetical protein